VTSASAGGASRGRPEATARKYLASFALGTECGLSHIGKDDLLPVLELHAAIAGAASG
jgi:hypothetical protein